MKNKYLSPITLLTLVILFTGSFLLARSESGVAGESQDTHGNTAIYLPIILSPVENEWAMSAANPERTSWTPEEIKGSLEPVWFKPFDAYIPSKVQIIASDGLLYVATARGLYALDANTGAQKWVYPTELPLGNSPTIDNGVAYVGGFDKKIHAIHAITGQKLWTFAAGAGFDTNPLIVENKIFAGNRDGYFYAIHATGSTAGTLAWKYKTGGPIHYSAAYKNGVVFFASNDSRAYALNAQTGALVWKSEKLPGGGFHSWWPVVYEDYVIFAGSTNYRNSSGPGPGSLLQVEKTSIFPNADVDPKGVLVGPLGIVSGDWANGTPTIDTSKQTTTPHGKTQSITGYFESSPWRRTYFVLDRLTGKEYTTDFDNDGKVEYAPILAYAAKGSGTRYPPVIGNDGVLYQTNTFMSDPNIPGGHVSGWKLGTPFISVLSSDWGAFDEPMAYSAGGNLIYWNLCCDRQAGAIDISMPNTTFIDRYNSGIYPPTGSLDTKREWLYYNYNIEDVMPGYNIKYFSGPDGTYDTFGSQNGIYGHHGDQNPLVPYQGKVYMHRGNAVIAFAPDAGNPTQLPNAAIVTVQDPAPAVTVEQLKTVLAAEVQKMLDAGHLRPGYSSTGIFDVRAQSVCGDNLVDYWHFPGDTLLTLIEALPYLPASMQQPTRDYIESEFTAFPPYIYDHIGWKDGAAREIFDLPPETAADLVNYPPSPANNSFQGWDLAPHSFYAMWKYAEEFGGASTIFNLSKTKLPAPPANSLLLEMPYVHNAYIAGYIGYINLAGLAGQSIASSYQTTLNSLLTLRATSFSQDGIDAYYGDPVEVYCRTLNVSRNFMYMVPELAEYLHNNANSKVQQAVDEYEYIAPYWFVSRFEGTFGEGVLSQFYDYHSIFQAKALILQEPYSEMVKYLDVPAVAVGDLFYIHNLTTLIETGSP